MEEEKVVEILLAHDYIAEEDVENAEAVNAPSVVQYLIDSELLSRELVGEAIAEAFNTSFTNLDINTPSSEMIQKIPEEFARGNMVVLLYENEKSLTFATSEIDRLAKLQSELEGVFPNKTIEVTYGFPEDIEDLFNVYKSSLEQRLNKIIGEKLIAAPDAFVEIISEAIDQNASDIHFEPQEEVVSIRFRIDGVLQKVGNTNKKLFDNVLNIVKVLANIRIDEHYKAQDGAIRVENKGLPIDLRVSIAPTIHGQNVVIRILSQYIRDLGLSELGLSKEDQGRLENAYKKPFGMILTVGPTGSGKTTTLYSVIKILNKPGVNITTIEDPVEYKIAGVNQIQVNKEVEITFANGLRTIVRQDPNVILVGEIRDNETSEIAINAALTGHLLLSTFHANDASTVIPRLIDMGAEPFLLSSTLNLIVAQRLARRICTSCRYSYEISIEELSKTIDHPEHYFDDEQVTLYKGKGCSVCNGSGYKGRIGIYEMIDVKGELQEIILSNPSNTQIKEVAKREGSKTFFEDGIDKVNNGVISLEELIRVIPPPTASSNARK